MTTQKKPAIGTYYAYIAGDNSGVPEVHVMHNTIGNIVWTRPSNGHYRGTLTGEFKNYKTFITYLIENFGYQVSVGRWDNNQVYVEQTDTNGNPSNGLYAFIKIEVFNEV